MPSLSLAEKHQVQDSSPAPVVVNRCPVSQDFIPVYYKNNILDFNKPSDTQGVGKEKDDLKMVLAISLKNSL